MYQMIWFLLIFCWFIHHCYRASQRNCPKERAPPKLTIRKVIEKSTRLQCNSRPFLCSILKPVCQQQGCPRLKFINLQCKRGCPRLKIINIYCKRRCPRLKIINIYCKRGCPCLKTINLQWGVLALKSSTSCVKGSAHALKSSTSSVKGGVHAFQPSTYSRVPSP